MAFYHIEPDRTFNWHKPVNSFKSFLLQPYGKNRLILILKHFTGFQCSDKISGLYADPEDCSKFYNCEGGVAFHMNCPTNLLYNSNRKYCDYPSNVVCIIQTDTSTEAISTFPPTSSSVSPIVTSSFYTSTISSDSTTSSSFPSTSSIQKSPSTSSTSSLAPSPSISSTQSSTVTSTSISQTSSQDTMSSSRTPGTSTTPTVDLSPTGNSDNNFFVFLHQFLYEVKQKICLTFL